MQRRCSHDAKIWLAYARSVDHTLSTFEIRYISLSENGKLWNQSKSEHWNCISQVVMFLQFCQQAVERVNLSLQVFCLAKLFALNPNASMLVIWLLNSRSPALLKNNWNNSVNMDWLSLAFLLSILKIEPDFHLKLSTAIGKHITTVGWSPMSNG